MLINRVINCGFRHGAGHQSPFIRLLTIYHEVTWGQNSNSLLPFGK